MIATEYLEGLVLGVAATAFLFAVLLRIADDLALRAAARRIARDMAFADLQMQRWIRLTMLHILRQARESQVAHKQVWDMTVEDRLNEYTINQVWKLGLRAPPQPTVSP